MTTKVKMYRNCILDIAINRIFDFEIRGENLKT